MIAPWAGINSEIVRRDVQIDELTSANVSYAQDLRELRAQLLALSSHRRWTMTNFFFSKLPQGHAILTIARAAALTTIQAEAMVVAAPASTIDDLRRQCAAIVWVSSDVYSVEAIEKLSVPDRAYLLKLFGLGSGGTSKAQARRIHVHIQSHRPAAAGPNALGAGGAADSGAGAGGGGAGGVPSGGLASLGGALLAPATGHSSRPDSPANSRHPLGCGRRAVRRQRPDRHSTRQVRRSSVGRGATSSTS